MADRRPTDGGRPICETFGAALTRLANERTKASDARPPFRPPLRGPLHPPKFRSSSHLNWIMQWNSGKCSTALALTITSHATGQFPLIDVAEADRKMKMIIRPTHMHVAVPKRTYHFLTEVFKGHLTLNLLSAVPLLISPFRIKLTP